MDFKTLGFFDNALLSSLQDMMDLADEATAGANSGADIKQANAPSRAYVRDAKAMARTPADVKELPSSYQFVVDMPGVGPAEVKVQLEDDDGVLVVSGERKRDREEKEKEGVKYLRMERRMGKFMRKFALPDNAKREAISAVCKDGVLTVTVEKVPPPEPKKPKLIQLGPISLSPVTPYFSPVDLSPADLSLARFQSISLSRRSKPERHRLCR